MDRRVVKGSCMWLYSYSLWPRSDDKEAVGVLVNCPAYYSVSAPKAELLNKIKAMPEEVNEEEEQADINEKKVKKEWGTY